MAVAVMLRSILDEFFLQRLLLKSKLELYKVKLSYNPLEISHRCDAGPALRVRDVCDETSTGNIENYILTFFIGYFLIGIYLQRKIF